MDIIIINSPNLISQVRRRWLIGESVEGGVIGEYASDEYRMYKMFLNPLANGNVDLTLTGSLSENLTLKNIGLDKFMLFSTDEKYQKIGKKYGFEEFGLNDEEWYEMSQEIISVTVETLLNKIYA